MTQAYPLQWPASRQRTSWARRKNGSFRKDGHAIGVKDAVTRLQEELERLGATDYVLSTNLERNLDGSLRARTAPADPGVALYFTLKGKPHCMPCDTYNSVAQNIAGIAAHIEATRAIERYGVSTVAEMFTGFLALPSGKRPWREVLELTGFPNGTITKATVENAFRGLAAERHPDKGGTDAMMSELNIARADALREISGN